MARSKTVESLISAAMILIVALILILARGDAQGCWVDGSSEKHRHTTSGPSLRVQ